MSISTFAEFIAPVSESEFFDRYWNRSSVLIRGSAEKCSGTFSWAELNRLLCEHRLTPQQVRLSHHDKSSDELAFISQRPSITGRQIYQIDLTLLYSLIKDGASLVLDAVDEMSGPVREMCEVLGRKLECQFSTNAYATWGDTPGFGLHWDDHDLFVFQISGRKRWKLYQPTRHFPLPRDVEGNYPPTDKQLVWDEVLNPGDVVYIPRGHWHDVRGLNEPTLHLTCGFANPNGIDFLGWIVDELRDNPVIRSDLPRFKSSAERLEHVRRVRHAVVQKMQDEALNEFDEYHRAKNQARTYPSFPIAIEGLGKVKDASIRLTSISSSKLINVKPHTLMFRCSGKEVEFAKEAEPLLRKIMRGDPCRLSDLIADCEGHLDELAVKQIIEVLMSHALIQVYDAIMA